MAAAARNQHSGSSTVKAALWASLLAFLIHLVPIFLPRKVPSVELELASLLPHAEHRLRILLPLVDNPQSTSEHLRRAAELVMDGSPRHARVFLREAERLGPGEVENDLLRARLCQQAGEEPCVAQALSQARARAPSDPRPDLVQAEFAFEQGDTAAYLYSLERAFSLAPDDTELGVRLAKALAEAQRLDEAELVFDRIRPHFSATRARVEHALVLLAGLRLEAAREELEAAVKLAPKDASVRYHLGVALYRTGEWTRAESVLREADRLEPEDFRPLALVCALQRERGHQADASFTRALLERRFPIHRDAYREACPP